MKRVGVGAVIGILVALAWTFVFTKRREHQAREDFNARCSLITAGAVVSLYECDSVKVWLTAP